MKTSHLLLGVALAAALTASGYGLYRLGVSRGMQGMAAPDAAAKPSAPSPSPSQAGADPLPQTIAEGEEATRRHIGSGLKAGDVDPMTGRKVLYYHDPMAPGNKFDRPAKSPFMDMMLVPVYDGAVDDAGKVTVSPRVQQNLGLRTAEVVEGTLAPQVSAVGAIAFNERDQAVVQARATGYVERLHVRATLDPVRKGQALAELYVPEWVAAQEEFLAVRKMQGKDLTPLVDAARQRMRQVGMSDEQIRGVETGGRAQPRITLTAPLGGVVVELAAREGMTVMPGATLFRISGLGTVWAQAEVPESQAAGLRPGMSVRATTPAVPGSSFDGKVQALLPEVNAETRTLKARVELPNPGGRLLPGMFVTMDFTGPQGSKALLVPSDAVIQTGKRAVVMVAEDQGRFRSVAVEIGIESGGQTEIKRGLQAGQRVVVSGQFLIDSEASLRGLETRLNDGPDKAAAPATRYEGVGKIEGVDGDEVTLAHGPIPALKWGEMTMGFKLPREGLPAGMKPGQSVRFGFTMGTEGPPQITDMALERAPRGASSSSGSASAGGRP